MPPGRTRAARLPTACLKQRRRNRAVPAPRFASVRGPPAPAPEAISREGARVDRRLDFVRGQAALVADVIDGGGLEGLAHRHALLGDDLDTAVRFGYENAVGPPDVGLEGERGPRFREGEGTPAIVHRAGRRIPAPSPRSNANTMRYLE